MIKKIFICMLVMSIWVQADVKEIFKKIPLRYDAVVKVKPNEFDKMDILHMKIVRGLWGTEEESPFKQIEEGLGKIGIQSKSVDSIYFCFNTKEHFNSNSSPAVKKEISAFLKAGHIDFMMFTVFKEDLNSDKFKANLPKSFKALQVENFQAFKMDDKQAHSLHAIVLNPKLLAISYAYALPELTGKLSFDKTILANKKIGLLLKKNKFDGTLCALHDGEVRPEFPGPLSWSKGYRGGIVNLSYTDKGLKLEMDIRFNTEDTLKQAADFLKVGKSMIAENLSFKPIDEELTVKTDKNKLILELKMTTEEVKKFEKSIKP